ncbi:uncharacterized protein LOC115313446 [Ixodes scapularis]|uniref:uncharacterized protein LOC115313446 n=1 Tax=Ixodes scapularis TaxID=6945 RepID=UPI001A9F2651|nr:uncharacterized protein LOC115313446 [Ixodes scapularis]
MASWKNGLSEIEREMFAFSESVGLVPYAGTPTERERGVDERDDSPPDPGPDPDAWRLTTTAWCSCKRCSIMPTSRECVCCREIPPAVVTQPVGCVTEHPDYAAICLQTGVLRVAFWALEEAGDHPARGVEKCVFRCVSWLTDNSLDGCGTDWDVATGVSFQPVLSGGSGRNSHQKPSLGF